MGLDAIVLEPHWWWLVVALILGIAEIIVPGFFLIWLAAAAALVGVIAFVFPISVVVQALIFAAAAVIAVYAGRRWVQNNAPLSSDPLLNQRTARMVGEIVAVVDPIAGGRGRVRVADGIWNASGPDAAPGERVRIVGADGTTLIVEPVEAGLER